MRGIVVFTALLCATNAVQTPHVRSSSDGLDTAQDSPAGYPTGTGQAMHSSGKQGSILELPSHSYGFQPTSKSDVAVHPHPDPRLFIIALAGRVIFKTIQRTYYFVINDVLRKLLGQKVAGKNEKITTSFIQHALEKVTYIVFTVPINEEGAKGRQSIVVGADAGDAGKVRRSGEDSEKDSINSVTWDISDIGAHSAGNLLDDRPIVSDSLRARMIGTGIGNVTYLHTSSSGSKASVLAYLGGDGVYHYHWRPAQTLPSVVHRDQEFKKHFPFFDADGAGFKISAQYSVDPKQPQLAAKDAKRIAAAVVNDLLKARKSASSVGYEEQLENSQAIAHRLCFIAEDKKFNLDREMEKCFGKKK
ncbi:hypothetical protein K461DRAFT_267478 [Myriangium duriaei CBS 260.36]|uniref:Uncharacterized protein n=1 Tax=Myriangium duriaei CBS 260.36 TaxID=1168546 RepID=A0A9P4J3J9_9PEZI|nr:hypothetical protein K461DRAFT_267478 [Myriangium duriaei CBS 260.36]